MPTDAQMRDSGYRPEDFDYEVEVWPENWPVWRLYLQLHTQWRVGFNGKYALDYTPFMMAMQRMKLKDGEWDNWLDDLRVIEVAALKATHTNG